MTKRIEITDEMVERAHDALLVGGWSRHGLNEIKAMLEAALNPPTESQIPVTIEMMIAGGAAYRSNPGDSDSCMVAMYRAMRKLEPKG